MCRRRLVPSSVFLKQKHSCFLLLNFRMASLSVHWSLKDKKSLAGRAT